MKAGNTVIFCCGAYREPDYVFFLEQNDFCISRKLEILLSCNGKNNNCNAFIAELTEINRTTNEKIVKRCKNKDAEKFIEKILKSNACYQFKLETGSKSNMNWVYGENKERKNKKGEILEVVQKSVDFNNKKKQLSISIFLLITFLCDKFRNLSYSFFTQNIKYV